jgi:hypothetical protein
MDENENQAGQQEEEITNPETGHPAPVSEEGENQSKETYTKEEVQNAIRKRLDKEKNSAAKDAEIEAHKKALEEMQQVAMAAQKNAVSPDELNQYMGIAQQKARQQAEQASKQAINQQNQQALSFKLEKAAKEDPEFETILTDPQTKNPDTARLLNALASMNYIPNIAAVTKHLLKDEADGDIAKSASDFELKRFVKELADKLGVQKPDSSGYEVQPVVQGSSSSSDFDTMNYLQRKGRR